MLRVRGSTPLFSTLNLKGHPDPNRGNLHIFFMPFFIYIIYSPAINQYYAGHTGNLVDRLFRHNNSGSKATKKTNDWILKYTEEFSTKSEASQRELDIKKKKSRKYVEWLINKVGYPDRLRGELSRTLSGPITIGKVTPIRIGITSTKILPQQVFFSYELLCLYNLFSKT